jgi:uncharacterized protein YtpQ (UPF0354 family)
MSDARVVSNVFPRFYPILPSVGEADMILSEADSPVERRFLADLMIFYAFDLGDSFELVSNSVRESLGASEEELHQAAVRNLRALNLEVATHRGERLTMLTAGGNFEATLLLLPELWDSVINGIAGDIIAAVPARDIILFTDDSVPPNLAELRKRTSQAIEKAEKPLSRHFFRRRDTEWICYTGIAE